MIRENVSRIRQRILKVCSKINQGPGKITIIAISKGRSLEQVKETVDAGISDIGENRVQEAISKYNELYAKRYTLFTMGMTDDFGIAIEEGFNMVRLGRAIFE